MVEMFHSHYTIPRVHNTQKQYNVSGLKDSPKLSVDNPQSACCDRLIHVSPHAPLTKHGISWTPAITLNITLSAQKKPGNIIEILKLIYIWKAFLK